jgi:hypothetical protein
LSVRAFHLGLLLSALALTAWVFGLHGRRARELEPAQESLASPLALIPPGSAFVLSADIAQLRSAPLGRALAQRFGQLGGASGDLATLCGFDPLAALDQLALAVPSAGKAESARAEDFGVVATGRFSAAQITRCASAAISQRGGEPVLAQLGAFSSVRDRKREGGEVAARDGGLLIVSGGSYFRDLLDAAAGNPSHREHEDPQDVRHVALRRALGAGAILATWLLPEGWFERVAGEDAARLSSLRGLQAIGARIEVSRELRISLLLDCTSPESATEIRALLEQLRASLTELPLDPVLAGAARRIKTEPAGARLRLDLTLDGAELTAALDTLLGPGAAPIRAP